MSDNKATNWSITINNPTDDDYSQVDEARAKGWQVVGQLEKGEEGTPHLQLAVRTPHIRFGAVKKVFRRAHIEAARNPAALASYVKKEETRVAALPGANEFYPGMNAYFQLVTTVLIRPEKDGLDVTAFADGEVVMFSSQEEPTPARLLELLDFATRWLVRNGWHVEHYAVNPAVRSSWKKFGCEMLIRAWNEIRAKDENAAAAAAVRSEEEVNVPTVEHNHASPISPQVHQEAPTQVHPPPSPDGGPC